MNEADYQTAFQLWWMLCAIAKCRHPHYFSVCLLYFQLLASNSACLSFVHVLTRSEMMKNYVPYPVIVGAHVQSTQVIHPLVEIRLRPIFHTDSQSSSLRSASVTHRGNSPGIYPFIGSYPSLSHISPLLPVFPGIITQVNYVHSNPCLKIFF